MPSYARPRSTLALSPRQRHRHLRSGPNQVHSNHGTTRGHLLGQQVDPNVHPRFNTVGPATYYPPGRGEQPVSLPAHVVCQRFITWSTYLQTLTSRRLRLMPRRFQVNFRCRQVPSLNSHLIKESCTVQHHQWMLLPDNQTGTGRWLRRQGNHPFKS